MRISDYFGPIDRRNTFPAIGFNHRAKWVLQKSGNLTGASPSTNGNVVLPDLSAVDVPRGTVYYITNEADSSDLTPPITGDPTWAPFDIVEHANQGGATIVSQLDYLQTAAVALGGIGEWVVLKTFSTFSFTTASAGFPEAYEIEVASSRNDIVVDDEIGGLGWDGVSDCFVLLKVRDGATIGASSTGRYPVRATLTNNSRLFLDVASGCAVRGAGGEGGRGGIITPSQLLPTDGLDGGTAVWCKAELTVNNQGTIAGGGGGGGGGTGFVASNLAGGGGGGGAGVIGGPGGPGGDSNLDGDPGTATAGGTGGDHAPAATAPAGGDGGGPGAAGSNAGGSGGAGGRWLEFRANSSPIFYAGGTYQGIQEGAIPA